MLYSTATIALLASMMPMASAHYFFDKLVVNGQASADFVRTNTRETKYMPTKWKNTFDNTTPDSIDFRCNVGATNKASKGTASVKAGDELAMTLGVGATMQHPGPAQVYMSKAPSTAAAYTGDGEWFKIHQEGTCRPNEDIKTTAWCTWDKDRITFKIPTNIPDGEYLIRAEHIGLHGAHDGQAEFYYACAQVSVSGGSGSLPTDTVKIPGVYKVNDPEVNFSVWGGNKAYFADGPGPKVISASSSTAPSTGNDDKQENTIPVPSGTPSKNEPTEEETSAPAPSSTLVPAPSAAPSSAPVPAPAPSPSSAPVPAPSSTSRPRPQKPKCPGLQRRHARDIQHEDFSEGR